MIDRNPNAFPTTQAIEAIGFVGGNDFGTKDRELRKAA